MSDTKAVLIERIKELTCLYEVSSIIGNANIDMIEDTIKSILFSLKKAFQYPENTYIYFEMDTCLLSTDEQDTNELKIESEILIFNKVKGQLYATLNSFNSNEINFLKEENLLLDNVALKIGSLYERIEIQKSEISLRQKMAHTDRLSILGELTAGIAHELNTPLANILGFAELLINDSETNEKSLQDLDKIMQNAIFSREVVKKLMFFACEMPQEMKLINIIPAIKNSINLLDSSFKKEQVRYIFKSDEDEIWLRADPIQLTQIIFNLLINAIYFSPKDGLVTIEAYTTTKSIVLKIYDEGKGFTKQDLEKIFQPFYTTKPLGDGSGLGLSVVHGIVTSHKGTITAKNNSKKGAIFTIKFPKNNN